MRHALVCLAMSILLFGCANERVIDGGRKNGGRKSDDVAVVDLEGRLDSAGSDVFDHIMTLWAESFMARHPKVTFSIEGKGSSSAAPALIKGTSDLGPMSRLMNDGELKLYREHFGEEPARVVVAFDCLGIFVNKNNPLRKITLAQADAIFGSKRRRGYPKNIYKWGQIGLKGKWEKQLIDQDPAICPHCMLDYFRDVVFKGGDFKPIYKESYSTFTPLHYVNAVSNAIGYGRFNHGFENLVPLALSSTNGKPYYSPTCENIKNGKYPLGRKLYIYYRKSDDNPALREFLEFVLSQEGQDLVGRDGFMRVE